MFTSPSLYEAFSCHSDFFHSPLIFAGSSFSFWHLNIEMPRVPVHITFIYLRSVGGGGHPHSSKYHPNADNIQLYFFLAPVWLRSKLPIQRFHLYIESNKLLLFSLINPFLLEFFRVGNNITGHQWHRPQVSESSIFLILSHNPYLINQQILLVLISEYILD